MLYLFILNKKIRIYHFYIKYNKVGKKKKKTYQVSKKAFKYYCPILRVRLLRIVTIIIETIVIGNLIWVHQCTRDCYKSHCMDIIRVQFVNNKNNTIS